jgi:hypothetical protein
MAAIKMVANHLNNAMASADTAEEIIQIQKMFDPSQSLLEPHREFVTCGGLHKVENGKKVPIYFHLFNDILIYSTKVNNNKFSYLGKIDIDKLVLSEYNNDECMYHFFYLILFFLTRIRNIVLFSMLIYTDIKMIFFFLCVCRSIRVRYSRFCF